MPQKRHASDEVHSLIELANSVAPSVELPSPMGQVERIVELLKTEPFRYFRELTGPIEPDTFLSKLLGPDAPKTYNKVMGNYILLRDGRAWLKQTALIGQLKVKMRYLMPNVSAYPNERGELEFNVDPLINVLQRVEASRIRICPICGFIFWAARQDKPCCSIRCAKIRRTRLWRESYENKYKDQRSEKNKALRILKTHREREKLSQLKAPPAKHSLHDVRLPIFQEEGSGKSESLPKKIVRFV